MKETLNQIRESFQRALSQKTEPLSQLRVKYFGKSGVFTELMKNLKSLPPEERPAFGKEVNQAKTELEGMLAEAERVELQAKKEEALSRDRLDVTLPGIGQKAGSLHPLTLVKNQVLDAFAGLGFEIYDGPEVEYDYYSFEALNIPKDHPARDMQDTFYISENVLLRPHTSPAQIRAMQKKGVPIRILCPGKVFRADDDATHSPMFHQIEGLAVEKNISLADLKGVLEVFATTVFDKSTKVRFRPSFFPFTEPSVEVDVSCSMCHGKGCRLCKGTGWIEILGAGMVHRNVLKNCNVDPDVYRGFAFGLGIERVTMIKYGIPDMRLLFENDIRFLKQFI